MKKWDVGVNNNSFDSAGITKDCQEAVCELIRNGFEAQATRVEVCLSGGDLKESPVLSIIDNGTGINHDTIEQTFGKFLSSEKRGIGVQIKSQANKGVGRFSFSALSHEAQWITIYEKNNRLLQYTLQLNTNNLASVLESDEVTDVTDLKDTTGTTVEIPIADSRIIEKLQFQEIKQELLEEFAWYLYLFRDNNAELIYLGTPFNYSEYVDEQLSKQQTIDIDGNTFIIDVVVWKSKINNKSKIYYLGEDGELKKSENTSFNNNSAEFYHGVFVRSEYFMSYPVLIGAEDESFVEYNDGQKKIMRELKKQIKILLNLTFHDYLVAQADKYIQRMEEEKQFPDFPNDDFGKCRKKDFINVTKEIYCAEPKIFNGLKDTQAKTLFGFIALLLDSNERENLLAVMEQIICLTPEQREKFAQILTRAKLAHVIDLLDIIQTRLQVISELRRIVYDPDVSRFANERDHIQKIIERHYWLFGDQYAMLSADVTIKRTLQKYEKDLQLPLNNETILSPEELRQRMDIVLYGSRTTEIGQKESLVIELKAPSVALDRQVLSQIERYADIVRAEPQFSGESRIWKFFAVCSRVDDFVKSKYAGYLSKGKLCLASMVGDFEIYALSWDDVFLSFENRYHFMLENIQRDFEESEDVDSDENINRDYVNQRVKMLISMSGQ